MQPISNPPATARPELTHVVLDVLGDLGAATLTAAPEDVPAVLLKALLEPQPDRRRTGTQPASQGSCR